MTQPKRRRKSNLPPPRWPVVENGIKIPDPINSWVDYLNSLEVGQSFRVPNKAVANKIVMTAWRLKVNITQRRIQKSNAIRIWRIK